jgi:hypothetical protein
MSILFDCPLSADAIAAKLNEAMPSAGWVTKEFDFGASSFDWVLGVTPEGIKLKIEPCDEWELTIDRPPSPLRSPEEAAQLAEQILGALDARRVRRFP